MTLVLPLGLAVVFNAGVLGVGIFWTGEARRGRAGDGAPRHVLVGAPADGGAEVLTFVEEEDGRTTEIEDVHWPSLGWTDAMTLPPVEGDLLGWRERPFRSETQTVDYTGWTDEEVAAEIEQRFGDGA